MKKAQNILNMISTVAGIVGFLTTGASYGITAAGKIKDWKAQRAELKAIDNDFDDFKDETVDGTATV